VAALKRWRAERASALGLDPGVLCPNATLEAVAVARPPTVEALRAMLAIKGWLGREFGDELAAVLRADRVESDGAGS
jgi:ribonuclease D